MILPYGQPTLASDGTHGRPQERGEDAETDVIGLTTIEVCDKPPGGPCGARYATLGSGASSPVRNCARPFPKDQSSSEFVTIDTTTSDGGMPHVDSNSRQSRL